MQALVALVLLSILAASAATCCEQPSCPGPCGRVVVEADTSVAPASSCCGQPSCSDPCGAVASTIVPATTTASTCCGQVGCTQACGSIVKPATNVVIDNPTVVSCCGQPSCTDPCGNSIIMVPASSSSCCGQANCNQPCGGSIVTPSTNVVIDNPTVVSCCGTPGCTDACGNPVAATTVVTAPAVCCGSPGCPQPCPSIVTGSCCGQPLCSDPCKKGPVGRLANVIGNFTKAKAVGSKRGPAPNNTTKRNNATRNFTRRFNGTRARGATARRNNITNSIRQLNRRRNLPAVFDAKYDRMLVREMQRIRSGRTSSILRKNFTLSAPVSRTATKQRRKGWDYTQEGRDWTGLCKSGKRQSPINIVTSAARAVGGVPLRTQYNPSKVSLVNDGKIIGAAPGAKGSLGFIRRRTKKFAVANIHFHTPSEHQINGKRFPLEMQIVHHPKGKVTRSSPAVIVSVLFDYGVQNAFLTSMRLGQAPRNISVGALTRRAIHLRRLGLSTADFYTYRGSMAPPCSENVRWYIAARPLTASKLQVESLRSRYPKGNARAVQPLNGRIVNLIRGKRKAAPPAKKSAPKRKVAARGRRKSKRVIRLLDKIKVGP